MSEKSALAIEDRSVGAFFAAIALNSFLLLSIFVLFTLVSRRYQWIYQPRIECPKSNEIRSTPPEIRVTGFSWIRSLMTMDDHNLVCIIGLDATMFVRFFYLGLRFFAIMAIVSCGIIIPVHIMAGPEPDVFDIKFQMMTLTVGHVVDSSSSLWIHAIIMYFTSALLMWLLRAEYTRYVELRHTYFLSNKQSMLRIEQLSILLQDIPSHIASNKDLSTYLETLFRDDQVKTSILLRDSREMMNVYTKREVLIYKIEQAISKRLRKRQRDQDRPIMSVKLKGLKTELEKLNDELLKLSKQQFRPLPSGFVTFNTFNAAAMAVQIPLTQTMGMSGSPAPEPRDIVWPNIGLSQKQRWFRQTLATMAFLLCLVSYTAPVTFLASFTKLELLIEVIPALDPLLEFSPSLKAAIAGFLPSLAVIIVMSLIPPVLRILSRFKGFVAESYIERNTFRDFYYFQFIHVFLVPTMTTAALQGNYSDITIGYILKQLAESLPQASSFFIIMIMTQSLLNVPLELLIPFRLLSGLFQIRSATTATDVRIASDPGGFAFDHYYPSSLLLFALGIIYMPIAPLIVPFCALFCLVSSIVYRYLFCYVKAHDFEGGGLMFPLVFGRLVFALGFSQLTLIGVLVEKKSSTIAAFILPVLFITARFYFFIQKECGERAKRLVLEDIQLLDEALSRNSMTQDPSAASEAAKQAMAAYLPKWESGHPITYQEIENAVVKAYPLLTLLKKDYNVIGEVVSKELEIERQPIRNPV
uniref:CSC1/OSCA1-like 7TM region domain-containing protein n=1 Tax=Spongospora subterranea TaxID=70186 RepID=A0A0H5R8H2_9EUKA|eukprot:CRZ10106.1 hypothetical protein [Spongospora subterranea]